MKTRNYLLVIVIGILLIFGTGGAAFAQPPAFPVLNEYFVNIQGQVVGPYGADELRQLILQGRMTRDSFVWTEGMPAWAAAGTVVELAPLFAGLPPPLPTAPQAVHGGPWGGHPVVAGAVNTIFGIWSFTNDDFHGGLMTVGLQVGGIVASAIGSTLFRGGSNVIVAQLIYYAGLGLSVGGAIYGFHRGFTQFNIKTAAAGSFAEAINTNPLNNITLVAFPSFNNRGFVGSLTYSMSF